MKPDYSILAHASLLSLMAEREEFEARGRAERAPAFAREFPEREPPPGTLHGRVLRVARVEARNLGGTLSVSVTCRDGRQMTMATGTPDRRAAEHRALHALRRA